jgi:hypothetical protein
MSATDSTDPVATAETLDFSPAGVGVLVLLRGRLPVLA